jgi:phosphoribosyl-ATP pyrophosphohydrolase/phosphoribosyl-AMP cyclohydrolase
MTALTLDFEKGAGLVTVVAQHAHTGEVLMVAHADRTAIERTMESGEMHYHSRSRGAWHKGATSGNVQRVVSLTADCDGDAVLARVIPAGPACHTGAPSCFTDAGAARESREADPLDLLDAVIASRAKSAQTATSYTARLLADRNLRLKKLGEEAMELAIACGDGDRERAIDEAADVIYHTLVALRAVGASWTNVRDVLASRATGRLPAAQ